MGLSGGFMALWWLFYLVMALAGWFRAWWFIWLHLEL